MKVLPWAVLVILAVTVGTARADWSLEWRQVTSDSGTLESQHVADIPPGFKSWQLLLTTDTGWIGSNGDILLDEGTIYYNDSGGNISFTPPDAAQFGQMPSARFGSHLSGTGLDAADGQRQTPSFVSDPVRPNNKNKTYTDQEITTTWFTPEPRDEVAGTFVIMMLTLSDNAQGNVRVDTVDPERCLHPPGRECTAIPPFILDYRIVNGEIIVPEPSTALLAILGLMGALFAAARRRGRRAG